MDAAKSHFNGLRDLETGTARGKHINKYFAILEESDLLTTAQLVSDGAGLDPESNCFIGDLQTMTSGKPRVQEKPSPSIFQGVVSGPKTFRHTYR